MSRMGISGIRKLGFRDNAYHRPNDLWVCGWTGKGKPCRRGPLADGKCAAVAECRPRKDGDRWICTRSKSAGGQCPCGPTPSGACGIPVEICTPKRSLRNFRGVVGKWLAVVTVGVVAILISSPHGLDWLSPGPLTAQHAVIGECSACHVDRDESMSHSIVRAVMPSGLRNSSTGCLKCHEMGDKPLLAHNVSTEVLTATLTSPVSANTMLPSLSFARAVFTGPTEPGTEIACATCHQEHQGALADIKTMSARRCQACHRSSFASFGDGHSEFSSYPYQRQTRINFNHYTHFVRHFPDTDSAISPTDCQACHETGPRDRLMVVKPFDAICSSCHLGEITGRVGSGTSSVAFLTLPGLDLEALQDRGIGIGYWPEYAESPITPFMKLLLSSDEELRADISLIGSMDLLDLGDADHETLAAVRRVAWGVKRLVYNLLYEGPTMLIEKITMDSNLSEALATDMVAALPFGVVSRAADSWFPVLSDEISLNDQGIIVPTLLSLEKDRGDEIVAVTDDVPETDAVDSGSDDILGDDDILSGNDDILDDAILDDDTNFETAIIDEAGPDEMPAPDMKTWMQYGGWHERDFSLVYRPTKHSDPFFTSWISASGRASSGQLSVLARPVFDLLTTANPAGRCGKCHSIDIDETGGLSVNWQAFFPGKNVHHATAFSHSQHIAVLRENACQNCHQIDAKADYAGSFKDHDPKTFVSNFKKMEKAMCVECHDAKTGVQQCTDCHNYHIGTITLSDMIAPIE